MMLRYEFMSMLHSYENRCKCGNASPPIVQRFDLSGSRSSTPLSRAFWRDTRIDSSIVVQVCRRNTLGDRENARTLNRRPRSFREERQKTCEYNRSPHCSRKGKKLRRCNEKSTARKKDEKENKITRSTAKVFRPCLEEM